MKFYERKTQKKHRDQVREFLKQFNVRVHYIKKGWSSVLVDERLMEIDYREARTIQELWSIMFHELSHIYCYENNLYYKFHHQEFDSEQEENLYMHRYGLRAERFVDKKAKWLMSLYLPDIPFKSAYDDEDAVKWWNKWVKRNYPLK